MTKVDDMLSWTQLELGKPYVYGDQGPADFDCSGLVQYVLAQVGISAPRVAADQQSWATPVTSPLPGDLVFYGSPAHHVGIYLGAGKMIDAPYTGAVVRVDDVGTPTSYGRVPGLGTSTAPILGYAASAASTAGSAVSGVLGGARYIVIEGALIAAGLGLLVAGVWILARPALTKTAGLALRAAAL